MKANSFAMDIRNVLQNTTRHRYDEGFNVQVRVTVEEIIAINGLVWIHRREPDLLTSGNNY